MLDLPEELVPKKPVRLPKAMSPVSCQDLKFWMRSFSNMSQRKRTGPTTASPAAAPSGVTSALRRQRKRTKPVTFPGATPHLPRACL